MKTFLEHVASDLLSTFGHDLSRVAVVFPNKRASLFLNEHLARIAQRPIWAPNYLTISQLLSQNDDLILGNEIKMIAILYQVYTQVTGSTESLDEFYPWGQVLLADFDDMDKNLADAEKVFKNLSDIHEFDDLSYLTDEQKEVLSTFFKQFNDSHLSNVKERFIRLWSKLGDIYKTFKEALAAQHIAYEGMLYRHVIESGDTDYPYQCYAFVGFNLLQKVEQKLFAKLEHEGKALFYWDFDHYYMKDSHQEAGYYIKQYLSAFPNKFDKDTPSLYDNLGKDKHITYISAATENIQARYIDTWLRQNNRLKEGKKVAIVLCNEKLLHTVIHSIPSEVDKVNVTLGYPLTMSPVVAWISMLISMQTIGLNNGGEVYRWAYVSKVLSHPLTQMMTPEAEQLYQRLKKEHIYYPKRGELQVDDVTILLFQNIDNIEIAYQNSQAKLLQWLVSLLQRLGICLEKSEDILLIEAVFKMYTLLNKLLQLVCESSIVVDINTLKRLITQIVRASTIPFHGEPAEGLQIMGVLETRNLDFDHLLILSCNEGNMPKGVNDTSLIPYILRKEYGLTTVDHKVSIYAYYYYRLLQRAKDITILYNVSTEGDHKGEMSRFMTQLLVEWNGQPGIVRQTLKAGQTTSNTSAQVIQKTPEIMTIMQGLKTLSPTAINRYLRCPLQFYYASIAKIKEPDAAEDEIDQRLFGSIFHKSAEMIYTKFVETGKTVSENYLEAYIHNKNNLLDNVVNEAFSEVLFSKKNKGQSYSYNGLQLINREAIRSYLINLLKIDKTLNTLHIRGVEEKVSYCLSFEVNNETISIKIEGIIDRLDEIIGTNHQKFLRVIDYKTGSKAVTSIGSVDDIFNPENVLSKHSDYFLQSFLYAFIVKQSSHLNPQKLPVSPALLFIQHTSGDDYTPVLSIDNTLVDDISRYQDEFMTKLKTLLEEIYNPSIAFNPTEDSRRCDMCPYRRICYR